MEKIADLDETLEKTHTSFVLMVVLSTYRCCFQRKNPAAIATGPLTEVDPSALVNKWFSKNQVSTKHYNMFACELASDVGPRFRISHNSLGDGTISFFSKQGS